MTFVDVLAGALLIGTALGLLGGGTVLTVPLLHGLLGVATPEAIAMSLPIVAVAAAAGAAAGWWRGAFALTSARSPARAWSRRCPLSCNRRWPDSASVSSRAWSA